MCRIGLGLCFNIKIPLNYVEEMNNAEIQISLFWTQRIVLPDDQLRNGVFTSDHGSWTVIWGIRDSEHCESCGVVRLVTGK